MNKQVTRRSLFGLLIAGTGRAQKPQKKWYITGGRMTTDGKPRNDCTVPSLITYGTDRLDALANSGITVWEAADWERAEKEFALTCREAKARGTSQR